MPVSATIQTQLDAANATALVGTGYQVTATVGEKTVTWVSLNKLDLKDTLTATVNETAFKSAQILAIAV